MSQLGFGLYGAIFVKGVSLGSYPFSVPSVSLFDLAAGFFAPTQRRVGAGARRSGQGWRVSAHLDGSEHGGTLALVGMTSRVEPASGATTTRGHMLVFGGLT
jgi:hypothetical protein